MWCISSCWSQFSLGYRYLKVFLLFSSLSIQILFFHSYVAINLNQYQVQGDIIKCLYPYKLMSYCCYVFYLVFICGPYILRVQTDSLESVNIFSIVAHVFRNLFWKICPLFGKILITCLKSCKATYSKKMHWGGGEGHQCKCFLWILQKKLRTPSLQNTSRKLLLKNFVFNSLTLLIGYLIVWTFILNKCIISNPVYQKDCAQNFIYSGL